METFEIDYDSVTLSILHFTNSPRSAQKYVLMKNQTAQSCRRELYFERINMFGNINYINVNTELFLEIVRLLRIRKEAEC